VEGGERENTWSQSRKKDGGIVSNHLRLERKSLRGYRLANTEDENTKRSVAGKGTRRGEFGVMKNKSFRGEKENSDRKKETASGIW